MYDTVLLGKLLFSVLKVFKTPKEMYFITHQVEHLENKYVTNVFMLEALWDTWVSYTETREILH